MRRTPHFRTRSDPAEVQQREQDGGADHGENDDAAFHSAPPRNVGLMKYVRRPIGCDLVVTRGVRATSGLKRVTERFLEVHSRGGSTAFEQ